jgi:hypothetical protein
MVRRIGDDFSLKTTEASVRRFFMSISNFWRRPATFQI